MGLWTETCFLTRAPVNIGDPVVMVVPTPKCLLIHPSVSPGSRRGLADDFESLVVGKYDGYGWVHCPGDDEVTPESNDDAQLRSLFCHRDAWEWIAEMHSSVKPDALDKFLVPDAEIKRRFSSRFDELDTIIKFCRRCRVDIRGGISFKGSQEEDYRCFTSLKIVVDIQHGKWAARNHKRKKEGDE